MLNREASPGQRWGQESPAGRVPPADHTPALGPPCPGHRVLPGIPWASGELPQCFFWSERLGHLTSLLQFGEFPDSYHPQAASPHARCLPGHWHWLCTWGFSFRRVSWPCRRNPWVPSCPPASL